MDFPQERCRIIRLESSFSSRTNCWPLQISTGTTSAELFVCVTSMSGTACAFVHFNNSPLSSMLEVVEPSLVFQLFSLPVLKLKLVVRTRSESARQLEPSPSRTGLHFNVDAMVKVRRRHSAMVVDRATTSSRPAGYLATARSERRPSRPLERSKKHIGKAGGFYYFACLLAPPTSVLHCCCCWLPSAPMPLACCLSKFRTTNERMRERANERTNERTNSHTFLAHPHFSAFQHCKQPSLRLYSPYTFWTLSKAI